MVILIAAAGTVQDGYALRFPPISQENLTAGGSRCIGHPLKLQTGDDIIIAPVAIFIDYRGVELLEASGDNDVANLNLFIFIFHLIIDCFSITEPLTELAFPRLKMNAGVVINYGNCGHSIHDRDANSSIGTKKCLIMDNLPAVNVFEGNRTSRTDLGAGTTANTRLGNLNKRSGYLPLKASFIKINGTCSHHFFTHSGAKATKDT